MPERLYGKRHVAQIIQTMKFSNLHVRLSRRYCAFVFITSSCILYDV